MERVSTEALSAFAVFAEHLNLTKAAAALHISQPSLHAKLATLARQLDRPLYERVGRRLVLTPEGEAVARFARDRDERLHRFLDELHDIPTTRPGTVSSTSFTHYSMLRTTEQMLGLSTFLGNAASATSSRSPRSRSAGVTFA